ncbi:MAG: hypothetical protein HY006_01405 [Candidatus Sungbacteria bacterium]|nr:hypothetical protein [Candidatus Sungbacteria bacterium]
MMYLNMDDSRIVSIPQVEAFIKVGTHIDFQSAGVQDAYQWVEEVLLRFRYFSCRKKEKSVIREYIRTATGYSHSQITRLVQKKKKWGRVFLSSTRRHTFTKRYTPDDIARIIETDKAHDRLSGKYSGTKRLHGSRISRYRTSTTYGEQGSTNRMDTSLRRPSPLRYRLVSGGSQIPMDSQDFSA